MNTEDCFSKLSRLTLKSNTIRLPETFFNGVAGPCVISAPENFDFGVGEIDGAFEWKGGLFIKEQDVPKPPVKPYVQKTVTSATG